MPIGLVTITQLTIIKFFLCTSKQFIVAFFLEHRVKVMNSMSDAVAVIEALYYIGLIANVKYGLIFEFRIPQMGI